MSAGAGDWGLGTGEFGSVSEPRPAYESRQIRSFRDLDVWRDGAALAEVVYRETRAFPDHERFGLTSQLLRAPVSVASTIAEGWGRSSRVDSLRFLYIARGSLFEVATQVEIASRVRLFANEAAGRIEMQGTICGKRLSRLIAALQRPQSPSPNP